MLKLCNISFMTNQFRTDRKRIGRENLAEELKKNIKPSKPYMQCCCWLAPKLLATPNNFESNHNIDISYRIDESQYANKNFEFWIRTTLQPVKNIARLSNEPNAIIFYLEHQGVTCLISPIQNVKEW